MAHYVFLSESWQKHRRDGVVCDIIKVLFQPCMLGRLSARESIKIRAVRFFTEKRCCAPGYNYHSIFLANFPSWVKMSHPQARAPIMVGLEHPTFRLRGGDVITSSPLSPHWSFIHSCISPLPPMLTSSHLRWGG